MWLHRHCLTSILVLLVCYLKLFARLDELKSLTSHHIRRNVGRIGHQVSFSTWRRVDILNLLRLHLHRLMLNSVLRNRWGLRKSINLLILTCWEIGWRISNSGRSFKLKLNSRLRLLDRLDLLDIVGPLRHLLRLCLNDLIPWIN